jgi:hypothetical protein
MILFRMRNFYHRGCEKFFRVLKTPGCGQTSSRSIYARCCSVIDEENVFVCNEREERERERERRRERRERREARLGTNARARDTQQLIFLELFFSVVTTNDEFLFASDRKEEEEERKKTRPSQARCVRSNERKKLIFLLRLIRERRETREVCSFSSRFHPRKKRVNGIVVLRNHRVDFLC